MRVLVVEDSQPLADAIAEGFRDQGMATDVSYDGLDAAAKVDVIPYDVVVLDRDLPGLRGDQLCRMISESDAPTMILMLTASALPDERVSGLSLGADDYLSKPFHFPELLLRVRALARRKPIVNSRIFKGGGVELDSLRHTATRYGHDLQLSAREFGVLEALLRAQPAVLRAEDLLEQAWGENIDPLSNVVSVTISRLRRKLHDPPVIATIPGVGYLIRQNGTAEG